MEENLLKGIVVKENSEHKISLKANQGSKPTVKSYVDLVEQMLVKKFDCEKNWVKDEMMGFLFLPQPNPNLVHLHGKCILEDDLGYYIFIVNRHGNFFLHLHEGDHDIDAFCIVDFVECNSDLDEFLEYVADTVPYNGFLIAYDEDVMFMEDDEAMFVAYQENALEWITDKTWPPCGGQKINYEPRSKLGLFMKHFMELEYPESLMKPAIKRLSDLAETFWEEHGEEEDDDDATSLFEILPPMEIYPVNPWPPVEIKPVNPRPPVETKPASQEKRGKRKKTKAVKKAKRMKVWINPY